ncbi:MAG: hypothetical protein ACXWQO_14860 [Bdellovibrionota bacterium]
MKCNAKIQNLLLASVLALGIGSNALAGNPRCFLHGIIQPVTDNKEKTSLSDMIRMNFDIKNPEDKAKCEQMLTAYCQYNVKDKDYSPLRLKASFTPDIDKSETFNYKLSERCKLVVDD